MANPATRLSDRNNPRSNKGNYINAELNAMEVVKAIFEGEFLDDEDRVTHYQGILKEDPNFIRGNPKFICIEDFPSVFVWLDGAQTNVQGMGTHVGNNRYNPGSRKRTVRNQMYINVCYIPGDVSNTESHDKARYIGWLLQRGLINNLSQNLESHNTEIPEITFFVEPAMTREGYCYVNTAHIKIKTENALRLATAP